jgi:DNA-binding MarR family transcriptional regulator
VARGGAARKGAARAEESSRRPTVVAGRREDGGGLPDLDRLIHERLRLGIVSALAVNPSLSFNDLKALVKTTDGNLSVHARRLEEAKYIAVEKRFEGRIPRTEFRLTERGRKALERYLAHMEALIRAARGR